MILEALGIATAFVCLIFAAACWATRNERW